MHCYYLAWERERANLCVYRTFVGFALGVHTAVCSKADILMLIICFVVIPRSIVATRNMASNSY